MAIRKPFPIALELRQLGHEFIEGKTVFDGISTEIEAGSHVVINGQNGSGKSTLGKILAGQLTAAKGSLVWKQNEQTIAPEALLRQSSYTGPSTALHPYMSIQEVLDFHSKFRSWRPDSNPSDWIKEAGLGKHMQMLFSELSSGMKRRVLLTVSLCTQSSLVVLDEPCANLDETGIDWYQKQLTKFSTHTTLVICTNDRSEDFIKVDKRLELA
mgnify:FL=1